MRRALSSLVPDGRSGSYRPAARKFARQAAQFLELKPAMASFTFFADLRAACLDLPAGHPAAAEAVAQREAELTQPPRSLRRFEDIVAWLARFHGRKTPPLRCIHVLGFSRQHSA